MGDAQSQSLSRSYGSILPTSLTHIVLSARGFSPRRPAAVVGTTDGTSQSLWIGRRIFKGRRGRTGRRTNGGALPGPRASRRLDRFQARAETPVNKRRQLLPGPSPTSPSSYSVVADSSHGSMVSVREYRPDSLSRTPAERRACSVQDRLTRVRLPLTRNPRPRRPSKVSFE